MDDPQVQFGPPARVPLWIAGIVIGLLVASGSVPIIRAFPASYAGIPVESAPSRQGAASGGFGDAYAIARQAQVAIANNANARRSGARCPECGVVESMRQRVRSGYDDEQGTVVAGLAGSASGGRSGGAITADTATGVDYEFTVRFRDGSATVFNESSPRAWRPGSRVLVIGRLQASTE